MNCISCSLTNGELKTIGCIIACSQYFEASQDYAVPIPGFIVINSKRHIQSIDEFTAVERADFIEFLYTVRKGMPEALDITFVYMIQEEDAAHFHVWLFPRHEWMKEFGTKIRSVKPIMQWAQQHLNKKENLQKVLEAAEQLKDRHNQINKSIMN